MSLLMPYEIYGHITATLFPLQAHYAAEISTIRKGMS